jgi:hypothetical protein
VPGDPPPLAAGVKRAALAFSVLRTDHADTIAQRLTMRERVRLRDGLSRVRAADDGERIAALHDLVRAIRNEVVWPMPAAHNEADCPFRCVDAYPHETVATILEQLTRQQPLLVAVALCHLDEETRADLWPRFGSEARTQLLIALEEVPRIGPGRTRGFARDLQARLVRHRKAVATRTAS